MRAGRIRRRRPWPRSAGSWAPPSQRRRRSARALLPHRGRSAPGSLPPRAGPRSAAQHLHAPRLISWRAIARTDLVTPTQACARGAEPAARAGAPALHKQPAHARVMGALRLAHKLELLQPFGRLHVPMLAACTACTSAAHWPVNAARACCCPLSPLAAPAQRKAPSS